MAKNQMELFIVVICASFSPLVSGFTLPGFYTIKVSPGPVSLITINKHYNLT